MEASSSSPPQQPLESSAVDSIPDSTAQDPSPRLSTGSNDDDDLKPISVDEKVNKKRKKMKKKRVFKDGSVLLPPSSSSCGSPSSSSSSSFPAKRVVLRRRNPRALLVKARRSEGSVDAIGLPLGMSVAAVVALVRNLCFFVYLFDVVLGLLMPLCVISFEFGKLLVFFWRVLGKI
jgi:hypothetical protein